MNKDIKDIKILLISLISVILLILSANYNLDLNARLPLSINGCRFGKYPFLFLIGGLSGTWICLVISKILSLIFSQNKFILNVSNGCIAILGYHWLVYLLIFRLFPLSDSSVPVALGIAFLNFFICYGIILISSKFFPVILGDRNIMTLFGS